MSTEAKTKRPVQVPAGVEQLLGRQQLAAALGVSTRQMDKMVGASEFPGPDLRIGSSPRWRASSVNRWIELQSRKA